MAEQVRQESTGESEASDARAQGRHAAQRQLGKEVTSRKQAIAIGLSEARRAGGKVPARASSARRRTATRTRAKKK